MRKDLDFSKGDGLVPAIIQDSVTHKVLMLGYMNEQALQRTKETGKVTFFSRSKQRLWTKGETSENYLELVSIQRDCDGDTLLVKARPMGPTCHLGNDTCFKEDNPENSVLFLEGLHELIQQRKQDTPEGSYTAKLFESGVNKIAQKVGEEAVEVVIEAMEPETKSLKEETADLLFHLLVLLVEKGVALEDVIEVLRKRHLSK